MHDDWHGGKYQRYENRKEKTNGNENRLVFSVSPTECLKCALKTVQQVIRQRQNTQNVDNDHNWALENLHH